MQLSVQIDPVGDTTAREISAASQELRQALERVPGVSGTEPARVQGPAGAKGVADAIGQLVVSLAPEALRVALRTLQSSLARHPPTKVRIKYKDTVISFDFDPKTVSLQELTEAAERLRRAAQPA
jgi:hypothetical protein